MARPRTGETPIRHVRVSDELWGRVGDVARRRNRTLSAVVVDALEQYVDRERHEGKQPSREPYTVRPDEWYGGAVEFAVDHDPHGWPELCGPSGDRQPGECRVRPVWKVERLGPRGKRTGYVSYYCDDDLPAGYSQELAERRSRQGGRAAQGTLRAHDDGNHSPTATNDD